jgi:hypothetical protein
MPPHYIPLAALRLACRWATERATPTRYPVAVGREQPTDSNQIELFARR